MLSLFERAEAGVAMGRHELIGDFMARESTYICAQNGGGEARVRSFLG